MPTKKKTVVVVKTLQVSPKRKLFLSRDPADVQVSNSDMEASTKGNHSPKKPERTTNGTILSRSVLGDPAVFDSIDRIVPDELKTLQPSRSRKLLASSSRFGLATGKSANKKEKDDEDEARKDRARGDPLSEPDTYLELLTDMTAAASKARDLDKTREAKLHTMIPQEELNILTRENKVMALWQERQRDWQNIQANIGKRVKAGADHTLMMQSINNFRTRAEEYDLLQAVIPPVEKFGEAEWAMGLRGGGTRSVFVGHLFSGLSCEQKAQPAVPKMIRKPRSDHDKAKIELIKTGVIKAKSPRPSEPLHKMRRRLAAQLEAARPHSVELDNADALVVMSQPLFQWAKESSANYFTRAKDVENEEHRLGEKAATELAATQLAALAAEAGAPVRNAAIPDNGAVIELLSSTDVLLQGNQGSVTHREFVFRNCGSVALNYEFKPLGGCWERAAQGSETGHIYEQLEARDHDSSPRGHALQRANPAFFCARRTGRALPGETASIRFSFLSKGSPGVIAQDWELETLPRAKFVPYVSEEALVSGAAPARVMDQSLEIALRLHGYAMTVDENHSARAHLANTIAKRCVETANADEIAAVVRITREPLRDDVVDSRYRAHFEDINADLLASLSGPDMGSTDLYLTPERYADLTKLATDADVLCSRVHERLTAVRKEWTSPSADVFPEAAAQCPSDPESTVSTVPIGDSDWIPLATEEELAIEAEARNHALAILRARLLPEEVLRSFDEVDPSRFEPTWDGDIGVLQRRLCAARNAAMRVAALEEATATRAALSEKLRLKAEKAAARAAKKEDDDDDDDDDDEEEEEEEDEEEEDGEKEEPPKHPLLAEVDAALAASRGMVTRLVVQPKESETPGSALAVACSEALLSAADAVVEAYEAMLEEAALPDGETMSPLPSPYATKAGAARWAAATATPTEEVPDPKAKGKKGAPAEEAPSDIALDTLRIKVINTATEALVNALVERMALDDEAREMAARSRGYGVENTATVRAEDIQGSSGSVFMRFDGDAYTGAGPGTGSAFDIAQLRQAQATKPIVEVAELGARLVVLLYESPSSSSDPDADAPALMDQVANLQTQLTGLATAAPKLKRKRGKCILADGSDPAGCRPHLSYQVLACPTVADLHMRLVALNAREGGYAGTMEPPTDERPYPTATVTVLALENVCRANVVPPLPRLPDVEEGDDEETIPIGESEYLEQRAAAWKDPNKPHKVSVSVELEEEEGDGTPSAPGSAVLGIYTDPALAVQELLSTVQATWVDAAQDSIYPHSRRSLLAAPHARVARGARLLSGSVREGLAWAAVLTASSRGPEFHAQRTAFNEAVMAREAALEAQAAEAAAAEAARQEREAAGEPEPESEAAAEGGERAGEGTEDEEKGKKGSKVQVPDAPVPISGFCSHFCTTFPDCSEVPPGMLVVLGGTFRADKLSVLNALVDMNTTVFLTGEMAIPFLPLLADGYELDLRRHHRLVADNRAACMAAINRARVRAARVLVPTDVQVSEGIPGPEVANRVCEPDARDEGGEYEGDVTAMELAAPAAPEPPGGDGEEEPAPEAAEEGGGDEAETEDLSTPPAPAPALPLVTVPGYILDVGPKTIASLEAEVAAAAMTMVWGPPGLVEVGAFQSGHRALIAALDLRARTTPPEASPEGTEDAPEAEAEAPAAPEFVSKTLLVGDSTVEWAARIADPDGSETNNLGDMVAAGVATFATRHSGLIAGAICRCTSVPLSDVLLREPLISEWVFNQRVFVSEDEEEEEEEEEEDDEDDEDD